ncbi:MAG: hypothetical protein WD604_09045 [Balneolaceae bacterium]
MIHYLVYIFLALTVSLISAPDDTLIFSRDYMRLAYENWLDSNDAELVEMGEQISDDYGHHVTGLYQTGTGEQHVTFYINMDKEIYDTGIQISRPGDLEISPPVERIVSRMLWSATLTDTRLLSGLWFVGSDHVEIKYDDRIGSADELLKLFIEDVKASGRDVQLVQIRETDNVLVVNFETDGNLLELSVKPNLHTYLNGQTEVSEKSVAAWGRGEFVPGKATVMHDFHRFSKNENNMSVNTMNRDRQQVSVEFEKIEEEWVLISEASGEVNNSSYGEIIYGHWLTRNFPESYQSDNRLNYDSLSVVINIDGMGEVVYPENPEMIMNTIGWLGNKKISYTEVSGYEENDGEIYSTTYILYYDPYLEYQNMLRVRDHFKIYNNSYLNWMESVITILPAIRLDNIGDVYGGGEFPGHDFQQLFNIDVSN